MRLLFFTREEFPTHRVDVDVLFGRELVSKGHKIDFVMQAGSRDIAVGPREWRNQTVFVGKTCVGVGILTSIRKQILALLHDLHCLTIATRRRYDAIQVRDKFVFGVIALAIARLKGMKFFFWLSFPFPEDDVMRARQGNSRSAFYVYARGRLCSLLLYRVILPNCDHAFVQSERMKQEICKHGVDGSQLTPVPMGVDMKDIEDSGIDADSSNGDIWLGYLGTLDANRKLSILVDMLVELRRIGVDAKLLLIGDSSNTSDRQALEEYAAQQGVADQVKITGFVPRLEALRQIHSVDVCLSPIDPSPVFRVGSPTKLIEYMAAGLPVVANNHPEQQAVLKSSRAGVCVPWSARHFARGVDWILRHSREERGEMGRRGRAWVLENRTYSTIADAVESKYLELLLHSNIEAEASR